MKKIILFLFVLTTFSACQNDPISFPDYVFSAVYFPYQYPVRTITLGEDIYDNTLDLQHKCSIQATLAGVYDNKHDVTINVAVADSACVGYTMVNNLVNGITPPAVTLTPLPHDYYTLASNQIIIKKGNISGGVEVQLTDKFFADPKTATNSYVIPLLMTKVSGADSILSGKPLIKGAHPRLLFPKLWDVLPKNYVLYAVKYINPYHAYYLRRGIDIVPNVVGADSTIIRHPSDITTYDAATSNVSNWLCYLTTTALNVTQFPVVLKDKQRNNYTCNILLTFDSNGNCVVSSSDPTTFTATGTGKFVSKGEKNSFGNQDRDVLYLDYTINHLVKQRISKSKDTLLVRNRGVVMEQFSVK
jgi:hypothetical protein